ncbi:MAG: biotin transporter BioY [Clostridia bacterium]|nr:biotin transporter BioY [Clostridia bacterium]
MSYSTNKLTQSAILLALLIICSQLTIPLPIIPFTLQTLAVGIIATILPLKNALLVILTYLLMGLVGLPVFSNFKAGIGVFYSPVGGYLVGFFLYVIITAGSLRFFKPTPITIFLTNLLGATVQLVFGGLWMMFLSNLSLTTAISVGIIPFIIPGIIKILVICLITPRILKFAK